MPPLPRDGGPALLRFGLFELDLEEGCLRRAGRRVALAPQPFALLAALARRAGAVVEREELRRALWGPDVHVEVAAGLNRCVVEVRRALGDSPRAPRFVETLPRRGYRFLAPVVAVATPAGAARPASESAAPPEHFSARGALRRAARPTGMAALLLAALLLAPAPPPGDDPGPPRSDDREAQAAFAAGRALIEQGPLGWRQSLGFFERAARRDPGFGPAWYGIADASLRLAFGGAAAPEVAYPRARRAALEVLRHDQRPEAHLVLAAVALHFDHDLPRTEIAARDALRTAPRSTSARLALAEILSIEGRHAEAIAVATEATEITPACGEPWRALGFAQFRAHRYVEAARSWRRWAELHPGEEEPLYRLFLLHDLRGEPAAAAADLPPLLALYHLPVEVTEYYRDLPAVQAVRTFLAKRLEILAGGETDATALARAVLAAHLGDADRALADLEQAERRDEASLVTALADPDFDRLRGLPRFDALATRLLTPRADEPLRTAATTPTLPPAGNPRPPPAV
jgi:DNA-binding winged helix-turn-helix (wHTH) protein